MMPIVFSFLCCPLRLPLQLCFFSLYKAIFHYINFFYLISATKLWDIFCGNTPFYRKLKLQEAACLTNMVTFQVQLRHCNSESHTFSLFPIVCNPVLFTYYLVHFNHSIPPVKLLQAAAFRKDWLCSKPDAKVLCKLTDLIFWTSHGDSGPLIHHVILKKSSNIFASHFTSLLRKMSSLG